MVEQQVYRPLFVIIFAVSLGCSILDPFFPIYLNSIGATGLHLALIFSSYSLSKTLFTPLIGWLSDRRGRKNLIVAGLVIYSGIAACYLVTSSIPNLIIIRFVQGVGAALVRPIALAFVGDVAPHHHEGAAMGTFDISFYSALALGPIIGGAIRDAFGFPALFITLCVLCLFSLVVAMLFVSEAGNGTHASHHAIPPLARLGKSPVLLGLFSFIFTRAFAIVLLTIFLPLYMSVELKLENMRIGIIMASGTVLTALLLGPMGRVSDLMNRRALVVTGSAGAALICICIPFVREFWQLLMLAVLLGIFNVVSLPASYGLLVMEGNKHGMGLTMGMFNSVMNVGFIVGPFAGGAILDVIGLKYVFYAAGVVGLLGLAPIMVFKPEEPLESSE